MRLRGTGNAPEGQYAKDTIFDVLDSDEVTAQSLIENGWAERISPEEDPGRTPLQIANSAVRGDSLAHPVEQQIAEDHGYIDDAGVATDKAYAAVHEQRPDATPEDYDKSVQLARKADATGAFTDDAARAASRMESREGILERQGGPTTDEEPTAEDEDQVNATSGAKQLASEQGVDLAEVEGSGDGGRISKEDVQKHIDQQQS